MEQLMAKISAAEKRNLRIAAVLGILNLVALIKCGLGNHSSESTTFGLTLGREWTVIHSIVIQSSFGSILFATLGLMGTALNLGLVKLKRNPIPGTAIAAIGALFSFICWAATGKFIPLTGLFQGALMLAVPLIFGSMSGLLCERSGVINIAIEGQLLAGAFASAVVASVTHKTMLGLIVAPIAGAAVSILLATFAIKFGVDQVILGFVLNVLVIGLTDFLYKRLLIPYQSTWNTAPSFSRITIPILGKIPIIGPIFFDQTIIVYLMYAIVAIISYALFKTQWGLRTRSVGEHPEASDSVGINVNRLRFRNVVIAGSVAGLGGAYFTIGSVGSFGKEMTAGSGFIALAALIFGRYTPSGAILAALFFGFADNLQGTLSIIGFAVPSEFMLMVPYVATIIAVSGLIGRVRAPAADGIAYRRGESR